VTTTFVVHGRNIHILYYLYLIWNFYYFSLDIESRKFHPEILDNNRFIVGAALWAVLTSIGDDHDNPLLNDLLEGKAKTITIFTSPMNDYYHQGLLDLSQMFYDKAVNDCKKALQDGVRLSFLTSAITCCRYSFISSSLRQGLRVARRINAPSY
jgi:hypothetical protein